MSAPGHDAAALLARADRDLRPLRGEGRPDLTLAVVSHNKRPVSEGFLKALAMAPDCGGARLELVWVDNASGDGTFDILAAFDWGACPCLHSARLMRLDRNWFISGAVNVALAAAGGNWFLQADNDVLFAPEALGLYWRAIQERPGHMLSPAWLYTQRLLPKAFYPACLDDLPAAFGRVRRAAARFRPEEGIAAGSCWSVPADAARALGGWDERYKIICMDDDFIWRWLGDGRPAALLPLPVYHPGEQTRAFVEGGNPLQRLDLETFAAQWGRYPWRDAPRAVPLANRVLGHHRVARWVGRFIA